LAGLSFDNLRQDYYPARGWEHHQTDSQRTGSITAADEEGEAKMPFVLAHRLIDGVEDVTLREAHLGQGFPERPQPMAALP